MKITISKTLSKLSTIDYRQLKELQGNLKDLSEIDYNKILKSLTEFGFIVPLFVWIHKGEYFIADGHQRHRVLTKAQITPYEIPYIEIEAENKIEAKKKLLVISSQYGKITQEGYDEFTFDLDADWLTDTIHFDALPLNWDTTPEATEDDFTPPENVITSIVKGDIFELTSGKLCHRIGCLDATSETDVKLLMGNEKADMVFTDPPYGMNLNTDYSGMSGNGRKGKKYEKVIGDNNDFKDNLITNIFMEFDYCNEIFLWGADYYFDLIKNFKKGSLIVWDKTLQSNGDAGYNSEFELLWSKTPHKKQVIHFNWFRYFGLSSQDIKTRQHPTQKPLQVTSPFIKDYSKENNLIVDLYLGSGTTLIACEQLNRNCFGSEISPQYCEIIIQRYCTYMKKENKEFTITKNNQPYKHKTI